jgi:tRNA(Ile)-lysidine synthase
MLEKVRKTVEKYKMLQPGERVIVAVSGGPDSVALLHALCELRRELSVELIVAHLDHQMRPGSQADASFVAELAKSLELPVVSGAIDVPALIQCERLSPEEGARMARYRFLREVAQKQKANAVALGHTLNDRVETFFINLLRGAGLEGLAGMPPVRLEGDLRYIRPLIECTRDEVLRHLKERKLSCREDPTNRDLRYLRNRVRWELLLLLQKLSPSALEAVVRASEIARLAHEHLQRHLEELWPDLIAQGRSGELALDRGKLVALDEVVQGYLIREAIKRVKGDLCGIDAEHVERVLDAVRRPRSGTQVTLPGGLRVDLEPERVIFTQRKAFEQPKAFCYELKLGVNELPEISWRFELEALEGSHPPQPDEGDRLEARIDWGTIAWPLVVRNRRPGDRFRPLGLGGTKKLQDFFTDEKVPQAQRDRIPIVCDQQGILWVVGYRLDERARVQPKTKKTLRIRAIPLGSSEMPVSEKSKKKAEKEGTEHRR